jgi:hypothetical protein
LKGMLCSDVEQRPPAHVFADVLCSVRAACTGRHEADERPGRAVQVKHSSSGQANEVGTQQRRSSEQHRRKTPVGKAAICHHTSPRCTQVQSTVSCCAVPTQLNQAGLSDHTLRALHPAPSAQGRAGLQQMTRPQSCLPTATGHGKPNPIASPSQFLIPPKACAQNGPALHSTSTALRAAVKVDMQRDILGNTE